MDAPLAYYLKTMRAKAAVEEEAAEIKRAHDPLLEERLENEREWLEGLERHDALLEQRVEVQDSDCPPQWRSNNNSS